MERCCGPLGLFWGAGKPTRRGGQTRSNNCTKINGVCLWGPRGGASWGVLEASWAVLGPSWAPRSDLSATWGPFGAHCLLHRPGPPRYPLSPPRASRCTVVLALIGLFAFFVVSCFLSSVPVVSCNFKWFYVFMLGPPAGLLYMVHAGPLKHGEREVTGGDLAELAGLQQPPWDLPGGGRRGGRRGRLSKRVDDEGGGGGGNSSWGRPRAVWGKTQSNC